MSKQQYREAEMATESYWQKFTAARFGRRRALALAGGAGAGLAALGLVGCGGGSSGGCCQSSGGNNGLALSQPQDTTAQAKAGGVIKNYFSADILHFDALL